MPIQDTPQTSKQHAVPQNVMDVEFKLIGDLTMRQFAYLLVCGILAYIAFVSLVGVFKLPVAAFFTILGISLAFVPVQERGMDEWFVNFVTAMYSPTQRIWKKEPVLPQAFLYDQIDVMKQELITLAPTSSRRKLEKYLEYGVSEDEIDPLDIPEKEYIMKVKKAFAAPAMVSSMQPKSTVVLTAPPVVVEPPVQQAAPAVSPSVEEHKEKAAKEEGHTESKYQAMPGQETKKPSDKAEQRQQEMPKASQAPLVSTQPGVDTPHAQATPPQESHKVDVQPEKPPPLVIQPPLTKPQQEEYLSVDLMTPDRHSGRKFTSLLPSEGDIVLPIRGEKVLRTTAEQEIEEDIKDKAGRLKMLLSQIRKEGKAAVFSKGVSTGVPAHISQPPESTPPQASVVKPAVSQEQEHQERIDKQARKAVDQLKNENESLSQEIERLRREIQQASSESAETEEKQRLLRKLERQKNQAETDYASLHKQIAELQNKLKERKELINTGQTPQGVTDYKTAAKSFTTKPNVISGIVKDPSGVVIEDLLMMVKDSKGDPVRAFKTNGLGEFVLTTPLENGMYTIEVSGVNETEHSFDIISVEVKGEVISPIEITGR